MPHFTEFFTRHIPHWEALHFGELAWVWVHGPAPGLCEMKHVLGMA